MVDTGKKNRVDFTETYLCDTGKKMKTGRDLPVWPVEVCSKRVGMVEVCSKRVGMKTENLDSRMASVSNSVLCLVFSS